jgi:hypothetical protein
MYVILTRSASLLYPHPQQGEYNETITLPALAPQDTNMRHIWNGMPRSTAITRLVKMAENNNVMVASVPEDQLLLVYI